MLKKYILENPEFIKHCRVAFRKQRLLSFTSLYFVALFCFYFIMYISFNPLLEKDFVQLFKVLYVVNMGFIYMIHFYIGSYLTSNSLSIEKEKGTFDFLRMTTIERKVIAVGKLLGGSIFPTYLIALNIPFIILFAFLGNIEIYHLVMVLINLVIFGLLFHSMGLFSAIMSPKATASNSLSLTIPIFYSMFTLSLPIKTSNPFYALMIPLSNKITQSENLSFFYIYFPAYILTALMMIFLFYWLMKGVIRKIDSEANHIFTKKQVLYIYIGVQIFFTGFSLNSLIKGDTSVLVVYYLSSLFFNSFITLLINPTKEDSIVYINKPKTESTLWDSKAPIFTLLSTLNVISLIIGIIYNLIIVLMAHQSPDFGLGIYLSISTSLFSFIYTQIFYLCNLTFSKNSSVIALTIVVLSTFIPIPFNAVLSSSNNGFTFDMFLLNPLSILLSISKTGYFNLAIATQLIILIIISLVINVLVKSKKDEIIKKFKI